MDWKEIREWIQLAFVIVGGTIALFAFIQNLRQRKLENSLKLGKRPGNTVLSEC